MNKLCCVFNTPSLYRETIYSYIEKSYDCDWYFEDTDNKLKTFNTKQFRNVIFLHTYRIGPFYGVKGLLTILRKNKYQQYLMMGHSRNLSTFCFLLLKKIFYPKKKVYLWTHGIYGKETYFELLWKKMLLGLADGLLIYGDYSCNLMKQLGFNSDKLHAIHNSLAYDIQLELRKKIKVSDLYQKYFKNNAPVIVFIGRLMPNKKLDLLVEAICRLKQKGTICNLVFIGDGSEKDKLKSKAAKLQIENHIWFYGACYDEKVNAELIYNADLCVSPGNIGLTAMHALMFGCPVITHDDFAYQMPEFEAVKSNRTGNFFKKDDLSSLVDVIDAWLLSHKTSREQIRYECYKEIDTYWNPYYQMNILKSVIQ